MPTDIKSLRRWINWTLTQEGDRLLKKPMIPGTSSFASVNDENTWRSYEDAAADGRPLGFVLGKEIGLCIVDFDKVRAKVTDPWPDWVMEEVAQLDSFTEVSASGKGLHVLVWGSVPSNMNRQGCHTEIWDSNKAFLLTFNILDGRDRINERSLTSLHQRIEEGRIGPEYKPQLLAESYNKDRYEDVVNCDYEKHGLGRSEAVASALWTLARKHKFDADKVRKEFEETALCKDWGEKWTRLGEKEIERAITMVRKLEVAKPQTTKYALTYQLPPVVSEGRQYVLLPKHDYDGWFMRGCVSLIGGSSGAGKTTLMLDLLDKQSRGEDCLGHKGAGLPFMTVFSDRGPKANEETLERMKLDPRKMNICYLPTCWGQYAVERIIAAIEKSQPMPAIIFVEGADMLVEDPNKAQVVAPFMSGLQEVAERYQLSLILSTGSPKQSKDRGSALKRDGIFGSQIWPRMATSILKLDTPGDGTGAKRELFVLHRNAQAEKFDLAFSQGKLVQTLPPSQGMTLASWASTQGSFDRQTAKEYFKTDWKDIKKKIDGLIDGGTLREVSQGRFEYVRPELVVAQ